jgi:hypothetical protein
VYEKELVRIHEVLRQTLEMYIIVGQSITSVTTKQLSA